MRLTQKSVLIVIFGIILTLCTACTDTSRKPEAALWGQWVYAGGEGGSLDYAYDLSFQEDGSLNFLGRPQFQSAYVIIAPGRIKLSMDGSEEVLNYTLEKETLTLYFSDGRNTYTRAPETRPIAQRDPIEQPSAAEPTVTLMPTATSYLSPFNNIDITYIPIGSIPISNGEALRAVEEKDGYLYVLNREGILFIYDIKSIINNPTHNPLKIDLISSLDVVNGKGLLRNGGFLYAFGRNGLSVINIDDPENPFILKTTSDFFIFSLIMHDDYLVAGGSGRIVIYSITEPSKPIPVGIHQLSNKRVFSLAIFRDYLYTSEFEELSRLVYKNTMHVFDFSDPSNILLISNIQINETAYHMKVLGDILFTCHTDSVVVWDLDTPSAPTMLNEQQANARVCLLDDMGYLFTNGKIFNFDQNTLLIFDIFNSSGNQISGFPYGSIKISDFVFITQTYQILILSKTF